MIMSTSASLRNLLRDPSQVYNTRGPVNLFRRMKNYAEELYTIQVAGDDDTDYPNQCV